MTEQPQDQPHYPQDQPQQQSYGQQPGEPMPPYSQQAPPYYGTQPTPPGVIPGQVPAYGYQGPPPVSPSDARMYSLFAHLGGWLLSFLVPLVIYLVYKDRDPFIRRHSAQALNFLITIYIIYVVSIPLMFVIIGFFTFTAAAVCQVVFTILAAVAANHGQEYTYPMTPKMIN
jgi:uncharacterized Tic20 family protein